MHAVISCRVLVVADHGRRQMLGGHNVFRVREDVSSPAVEDIAGEGEAVELLVGDLAVEANIVSPAGAFSDLVLVGVGHKGLVPKEVLVWSGPCLQSSL